MTGQPRTQQPTLTRRPAENNAFGWREGPTFSPNHRAPNARAVQQTTVVGRCALGVWRNRLSPGGRKKRSGFARAMGALFDLAIMLGYDSHAPGLAESTSSSVLVASMNQVLDQRRRDSIPKATISAPASEKSLDRGVSIAHGYVRGRGTWLCWFGITSLAGWELVAREGAILFCAGARLWVCRSSSPASREPSSVLDTGTHLLDYKGDRSPIALRI